MQQKGKKSSLKWIGQKLLKLPKSSSKVSQKSGPKWPKVQSGGGFSHSFGIFGRDNVICIPAHWMQGLGICCKSHWQWNVPSKECYKSCPWITGAISTKGLKTASHWKHSNASLVSHVSWCCMNTWLQTFSARVCGSFQRVWTLFLVPQANQRPTPPKCIGATPTANRSWPILRFALLQSSSGVAPMHTFRFFFG